MEGSPKRITAPFQLNLGKRKSQVFRAQLENQAATTLHGPGPWCPTVLQNNIHHPDLASRLAFRRTRRSRCTPRRTPVNDGPSLETKQRSTLAIPKAHSPKWPHAHKLPGGGGGGGEGGEEKGGWARGGEGGGGGILWRTSFTPGTSYLRQGWGEGGEPTDVFAPKLSGGLMASGSWACRPIAPSSLKRHRDLSLVFARNPPPHPKFCGSPLTFPLAPPKKKKKKKKK